MADKDTDFYFDAAIEEFFQEWPAFKNRVFVVPDPGFVITLKSFSLGDHPDCLLKEHDDRAGIAYKAFCRENGFSLFPHIGKYYSRDACVYPADSNPVFQGDMPGIIPRWPGQTDLGEFSLFKIFSGDDIRPLRDMDPDLYLQMWNQFRFDHEMGHILMSARLPPRDRNDPDCIATVISENAADLYGLMRHYQRYGHNTGFGQKLIEWRYINLILHNDHGHHTVPAIRQFEKMKRNGDLDPMSLEEIRETSLKLSQRHYHHARMNRAFERHFNRIAKAFKNTGDECHAPVLQKIVKCARKTKFHEIREACCAYLKWAQNHFPEKNIENFDFNAAFGEINNAAKGIKRPFLSRVFNALSFPVPQNRQKPGTPGAKI